MESKRLIDEATRLRNSADELTAVRAIPAGLTLIGLSFKALVAIWPPDTLNEVEAKLALAEVTGPHLSQEVDYVANLQKTPGAEGRPPCPQTRTERTGRTAR